MRAHTHTDDTHIQAGWLAGWHYSSPLSGGARVTTTASRKDNHSHTALGFPRGRGRWREKRGRGGEE